MNVEIRSHGVVLDEELRVYAERRVRFAFHAFGDAILRVRIRIHDENGPRGGEDKACRVTVSARPAIAVLVEDVAETAQGAVGRAVERAASALRRGLDRSRDVRRVS
jgi:ribosome-associated translation inhibitor RaiA